MSPSISSPIINSAVSRPSKLRSLLRYDLAAYERMLAIMRASAFAKIAAR